MRVSRSASLPMSSTNSRMVPVSMSFCKMCIRDRSSGVHTRYSAYGSANPDSTAAPFGRCRRKRQTPSKRSRRHPGIWPARSYRTGRDEMCIRDRGQTAFFCFEGLRALHNLRVEHHHILTLVVKHDDTLQNANHVGSHTHASVPVGGQSVQQIPRHLQIRFGGGDGLLPQKNQMCIRDRPRSD